MKKLDQKTILILIAIILIIISFIFLNKSSKDNSINKNPTPTEIGCKKAGCSNALCVEADQENTITTCEWKEEYGCYQKAECERQSNGKCGFTKDEELNNCLGKLIKIIKRSPLK